MKALFRFALRFIPRKYLQLFSKIGLKILSIFYLGKGVQCTVCDAEYRKFMPYGRIESRENALCPNCLSLERHRLMWTFLKEHTTLFTEKLSLLHVAPEICFIEPFKALKNLDYKTADIESPWADIKMDIMNIPLEDHSFDVIFCNHVLEHVDDDLVALKEFYRVLKPGGWAILQSPIYYHLETTYEDPNITDPKEREIHFGQDDHQRIFGKDYDKRLSKGGFEVEEFDFVKSLSNEEIKRLGYDGRESIYLCKKAV